MMGAQTKGIMLVVSSNFIFCAMVCLVKCMHFSNVSTTSLFRFVIGMAIMGVLALSGKIKLTFIARPLLFWRGLLGGISVYISFLSVMKLGISKASVICYMYPIFATLFGVFMLKEKVSGLQIGSIIVSVAGMVLLVAGSQGVKSGMFECGVYEIIAIIGAVIAGLAVILVKKLHDTDTSGTIFFAQCLIGFWIVLLPGGSFTSALGMVSVLYLVGIGILAAFGQLFFTEGYKHLSVATGSILILSAPMINVAAGIVFFHEKLSGSAVVGALLVIGASAVALKGGK